MLTRAKQNSSGGNYSLDTSKLLFIMTGAFIGLEDIVEKREKRKQMGFALGGSDTFSDNLSPLKGLIKDDLIEYGLIPELIGRIRHYTVLEPLTEADLKGILLQLPDSPIKQQEYLFRLHGISLEYSDSVIQEIAARAVKAGNGARGLYHSAEQCIKHVDFKLSELWQQGIRKIEIHNGVLDSAMPHLFKHDENIIEPAALEFRKRVFCRIPNAPLSQVGNEPKEIRKVPVDAWENLAKLKHEIRVDSASASAQEWWAIFEKDNVHRVKFLTKVATELISRKASLQDFFIAFVYSDIENIQANLEFLDCRILDLLLNNIN